MDPTFTYKELDRIDSEPTQDCFSKKIFMWEFKAEIKNKDNKHNVELRRTDPGTNDIGGFSIRGFPIDLVPTWNVLIFIVLVRKNTLKW